MIKTKKHYDAEILALLQTIMALRKEIDELRGIIHAAQQRVLQLESINQRLSDRNQQLSDLNFTASKKIIQLSKGKSNDT